MIRVNLLPHRELKRQARRRLFGVLCVVSAVIGGAIVGAGGVFINGEIASQNDSNAFIKKENAKLDDDIKEIAKLRDEIEGLKARQKAVEDLQTDRNIPVYLLNELVRQAPEGVYFTAIKQTGQVVSVTGVAQTNERVSELLRNTQNNSPWLERPELVEIKAAPVNPAARDQRRLYEFSMRVNLKRPQGPAGAASAAADRKLS